MSTVNPTLDQILFEIDYPEKAELLEQLVRRGRALALTAVEAEVRFPWHGEEWVFTPGEPEFVPPQLAIHFLELYGVRGRYRDRDQASGHSRSSFRVLQAQAPARAELIRDELRFIDGYLTHDPSFERSKPKPRARAAAKAEPVEGEKGD